MWNYYLCVLNVFTFLCFSAAGAYVTLTVRPADMTSMPGMIGGNGARSHHLQTPHERVTAPLPANVSGPLIWCLNMSACFTAKFIALIGKGLK